MEARSGIWRKIRPLLVLGVAVSTLIAIILGFWVLDKFLTYRLARSYIDQVADTLDVNKHLAEAITFLVAVAVASCTALLFSLSKERRLIGFAGLIGLLVVNSLILWRGTSDQYVTRAGAPLKCYFFEGDLVRYRERPGVDPQTGRTCREVTPQILWRLREYEKGTKPRPIEKVDVDFFDGRSGEPIVWYARTVHGIELFNLMGFHPGTGVELSPVSLDVISEWRDQQKKREGLQRENQAPRLVDPAGRHFFDPKKGEALLWYWRDGEGNYEFYDNRGFHPRTGQELHPITPDVIRDWEQARKAKEQQEKEEKHQNQKAAAEQLERQQERLRVEQEQKEREEEKKRHAERQRIEDELKRRQLASQCDRLAANPHDMGKSPEVPGVPYDQLKWNSQRAVEICRAAVETFPNELRLKYQLARAYQNSEPRKAAALYHELIASGYPAAYDNLGSLYIDGRADGVNINKAASLFRTGAAKRDIDSMFSLANLINEGHVQAQSSEEAFEWFSEAAAGGHGEAAKMVKKMAEARAWKDRAEKVRDGILDALLKKIQ
jgi:TPR repeat protein